MLYCRQGQASVKTEFFVGKYSHQTGPALYIMWYVVVVVVVVTVVQCRPQVSCETGFLCVGFLAWRPEGRERERETVQGQAGT